MSLEKSLLTFVIAHSVLCLPLLYLQRKRIGLGIQDWMKCFLLEDGKNQCARFLCLNPSKVINGLTERTVVISYSLDAVFSPSYNWSWNFKSYHSSVLPQLPSGVWGTWGKHFALLELSFFSTHQSTPSLALRGSDKPSDKLLGNIFQARTVWDISRRRPCIGWEDLCVDQIQTKEKKSMT